MGEGKYLLWVTHFTKKGVLLVKYSKLNFPWNSMLYLFFFSFSMICQCMFYVSRRFELCLNMSIDMNREIPSWVLDNEYSHRSKCCRLLFSLDLSATKWFEMHMMVNFSWIWYKIYRTEFPILIQWGRTLFLSNFSSAFVDRGCCIHCFPEWYRMYDISN